MVKIIGIDYFRSMAVITLDNAVSFRISRIEADNSGFHEGISYDEESFFRTVQLIQYPKALNNAVSMLSRRPCSSSEIINRLKKYQYLPDVIDLVLFKLKRENLIDDRAFCEHWVSYRIGQNYGPSRIIAELRTKGISRFMAEEALAKFDPDEQMDHSVSLAVKAWLRTDPDEGWYKSRQKIIAYLVRKGYSWETAKKACVIAEQEMQKKTVRR